MAKGLEVNRPSKCSQDGCSKCRRRVERARKASSGLVAEFGKIPEDCSIIPGKLMVLGASCAFLGASPGKVVTLLNELGKCPHL